MRVIGLTGGLASGKSTVAGMFRQLGARVFDADRIVRRGMLPEGGLYRKVVKIFGKDILKRTRIDRRKLAGIVFNDRAKLRKLEGIVHPYVRKIMKEGIRQSRTSNPNRMILLEVPLLFEAGFDDLVDVTVVATCRQAQQVRRAVKKNRMSPDEAMSRIRHQMPLKKKERLADYIIDTSQSMTFTKKQVKDLWLKLQQTKKQA